MTTPIMPSCMKAPVQQMLGQLGTRSSESSVPASACSTNQWSVLLGLYGPITGQYYHYLALLPRPGHVDVAVVQTRELVTQDPAPIRDQYCGLWTNQKAVLASSGPIRDQYSPRDHLLPQHGARQPRQSEVDILLQNLQQEMLLLLLLLGFHYTICILQVHCCKFIKVKLQSDGCKVAV